MRLDVDRIRDWVYANRVETFAATYPERYDLVVEYINNLTPYELLELISYVPNAIDPD